MFRLSLLVFAMLFASTALAMHCPQDMARIDAILESDPPADEEALARVQELRAAGEDLHEAGRNVESVAVHGEALEFIGERTHVDLPAGQVIPLKILSAPPYRSSCTCTSRCKRPFRRLRSSASMRRSISSITFCMISCESA